MSLTRVRSQLVVLSAVFSLLVGCSGSDEKGRSCSVADNGDGTVTMACDDGSTATWSSYQRACVLTFDDAYAELGEGGNPEAYYGVFGLSFDNAAGYGLIGGEGGGDPGNWNVEGSNGSAAWGLWDGTHSIAFDNRTRGVRLDFLRGYDDDTGVVTASLDATVVATAAFALSGAYDVSTVVFDVWLDKVEWTSTAMGIGLDNVQYGGVVCP